MLLVGVLLLSFSLSAWAQKVSLNFTNTKVETVLSSIKKQTGMGVVFSDQVLDVNRIVSIQMKNVELSKALDRLVAGTGVSYEIRNKRIYFVSKKKEVSSSQDEKKVTVEGTVLDDNGEAVIGATVKVDKIPNLGAVTNINGKFKLQVPANANLTISYVGYTTSKVAVKNRRSLVVTMREDNQSLDEVVVIGYGSATKKDLTGAVSMVGSKIVSDRHAANLGSALQGAMAGVQITRAGGAPESNPTIRVRGITTMGTNDPLVLVDGVPGNLEDVNPNDVESVNVLKDAASAAIYGSQAAAGVILVTTKRAKANEMAISYNFEYGLNYFGTHPEQDTPERYYQKNAERGYNDNPTGDPEEGQNAESIANYRKNHAENPNLYPITDWHNTIYKKFAPRQKHVLTARGGNNRVRTNVTMSYEKFEGQYKFRDTERIMMRANNSFSLGKYLGADLDVNFKRENREKPILDSDIYNGAWNTASIIGAWYTDGRLHAGSETNPNGTNPLAYLYEGGQRKNWDTTIGGRASLYYKPFDGLRVTGVVAPRWVFNKEKYFRQAMPYTLFDTPDVIAGYRKGYATNYLQETRSDYYDITMQFYLNYDKRFGKHDFKLTAGYEAFYTKYETMMASRDSFRFTEYPYLDMGPKNLIDNGGSARENARRSYYGRFMYNYAYRYYIQANIRHDGASRFHKDHRWGNFPSFSAGWVVTEEKFMKNAGIDWLSFFKLRGSWGILGNERISGNYYPYQAAISFGTPVFFNNGKPEPFQSAYQSEYAVEDLTWESTRSTDVGVDAAFFNNRLRVTAEWFKKKTTDILLAVEIPRFVGFKNPQRNAGSMQSKGFEIDVAWTDQIGDFSYSISANFSDAVSKMLYLDTPQFTNSNKTIRKTGTEYDEWYGFIADGLYLSQEDLNKYPRLEETQGLGSVIFRDISGPEGKPDGMISPEYDRVPLGGSQPRYLYGGNIGLGYKNFDLSIAIQGVGKHTQMLQRNMYENRPWYEGKYWSPLNTAEENATKRYPRLSNKGKDTDNDMVSSLWLFNGRYFRLKNVTLTYTFPQKWTRKVSMKSAKVYMAVNDVFQISKYPDGWDPEGITGSYPITSQMMFGLQVTF